MGNTGSSDAKFSQINEVTIKEVIYEKNTIIIVSTLEAVKILKTYNDYTKTSPANNFAVVIDGTRSYILAKQFVSGSEKCDQGYAFPISNAKTPIGTCFRFNAAGVSLSVVISSHWQNILETWSPRFQGNEIIFTKMSN